MIIDLSEKAINDLNSGEWLTDNVIEAYVLCAVPNASLYLFPSEIISAIMNKGITNILSNVTFNVVLFF
jgi:hypothetical protein